MPLPRWGAHERQGGGGKGIGFVAYWKHWKYEEEQTHASKAEQGDKKVDKERKRERGEDLVRDPLTVPRRGYNTANLFVDIQCIYSENGLGQGSALKGGVR